MTSIWTRGSVAILLVSLAAPAIAAEPGKALRHNASKSAATGTPIAPSRFDLASRDANTAPQVRTRPPADVPPVQGAQFGHAWGEPIEGPSWSYQASQHGPVFEMGALGGGTTQDAPFLAHVAVAWQF